MVQLWTHTGQLLDGDMYDMFATCPHMTTTKNDFKFLTFVSPWMKVHIWEHWSKFYGGKIGNKFVPRRFSSWSVAIKV